MAQKLLKAQKRKIVPSDTGRARTSYPPSEASCEAGAMRGAAQSGKAPAAPRKVVLVGTYAGDQLKSWPGYYPYPLSTGDKIDAASAKKVNEIWLFKGTKEPRYFAAEFLGVKTRDELKALGYPAKGKGHGDGTYLLFKIEKTYAPANASAALAAEVKSVIIRTKDFAKRSPKVAKQLKAYLESPDRNDPALANQLPTIVTKLPPQVLRVCEAAVQMDFFCQLNVNEEKPMKQSVRKDIGVKPSPKVLCKSIADYSKITVKAFSQCNLFASAVKETSADDIRVIELFAGVGGFRIGLERKAA